MTEKKYQRYFDLAGKASFENWELYQEKFQPTDFPRLRTERLLIRPVLEQDAADIFEIRGDPDTADWAAVPCMKSIEDAKEYIAQHTEYGRGLSLVLGDEVIGLIEFYTDNELSDDFMGYYMKKSHRCKGYMTESLTALRKKWTDEGEEIPMLWIFPDNFASVRVAQKSGWTYLGSHIMDVNCLNQLVVLYK